MIEQSPEDIGGLPTSTEGAQLAVKHLAETRGFDDE
jgi:hypothetical protein